MIAVSEINLVQYLGIFRQDGSNTSFTGVSKTWLHPD